jgi:pseudouridine synthase
VNRDPHDANAAGLRLNRYLARAGYGSRRAVEQLIRQGRVGVDGETVTDLGRRVDPRRQTVTVDGLPLELPDRFRIYAFHKPIGVVSTLRPQGRQRGLAEFRAAAELPESLMPVGRLDADTSGLLLWTDDGDLSQALQRPASGVWKRYRVVCRRPAAPAVVRQFTEGGLVLDGRPLRPCRIEYDRPHDGRHWLFELQEGRNRQIRRMFAAVGNAVERLERIAVGPVRLGRLHEGGFRRLKADEVERLRCAAAGGSPGESGKRIETSDQPAPRRRTGRRRR